MTAPAPQVFHISPDWCGEDRLAQLFQRNGHVVRCHDKGTLAADILSARAHRRKPLARHKDVTLFTGLHRVDNAGRPPLEGWRDVAFLRRHYPDAWFLLTLRDPEAWIADRASRDGGVALRCYAHHWDLPDDAVIRRWRQDWHDHLDNLAALFGDDPRLIRVDIEAETPAQLCRRLAATLPLAMGWEPQGKNWIRPADSIAAPRPGPRQDDPELVEDVAGYCLSGLAHQGQRVEGVSAIYARWDGAAGVTDREGQPLPYDFATLPGDRRPTALLRRISDFKDARAEGVINDILRLGRSDPVRIDMQDARPIGLPDAAPLEAPVLCHNRREGARNVILWPLPGQHEIAAPGQPQADCPDPIPFADKLDRLVWRGHISGTALARPGQRLQPSHQILNRLRETSDPAEQQAAFDRLCDVPRMAFLRRWIDHPDLDIGMVLAWRYRDMASHPLLAPYVRPRAGADYFRRFRYQLTLSGYDHGSNFIGAIDSQSVLLKEEDGWQVYYLSRFKPWQHYIPVALHCTDLEDKLAWARANPDRCVQMSAAARAEVRRLANPAARREIMIRILDALAEAERNR